MKLTASEIDRLLKSWASAPSDEMGVSQEEYVALCEHAGTFKHRHLVVIIRATKDDALREQVMKYEIPARALLKNPLEGRLVVAALILGAAASIATIVSSVRSLAERELDSRAAVVVPNVVPPHRDQKDETPSRAPEPTPMAVTPPAAQKSHQP